jgi:hypothetical protein
MQQPLHSSSAHRAFEIILACPSGIRPHGHLLTTTYSIYGLGLRELIKGGISGAHKRLVHMVHILNHHHLF